MLVLDVQESLIRVKMEECGSAKRREMEERGPKNVDVPPEIIHEIVSRLPVKALYRFKCVSKPWRSLITDPYFIANYNNKAIENKDVFISRRRLLFTVRGNCSPRLYSLDLDQLLNENRNVDVDGLVADPTKLHYVSDEAPYSPLWLHSYCGLYLSRAYVNNRYGYSLDNPITMESKKLPVPPITMKSSRNIYGLGFDHSANEFKVINGQLTDDGIVFSVYTLQTDAWRQIDYLSPYKEVQKWEGIMVNNAIHWLAQKIADESWVIISFLLAEEEVREIAPLPITVVADYIWTLKLGAFRNGLCMTVQSSRNSVQEFWVMKVYGVRESWTKMKISRAWKQLEHSGFLTESHDLMVFDEKSLVMYNFNDGTFWNLSISNFRGCNYFGKVGTYLESLLPSLIN